MTTRKPRRTKTSIKYCAEKTACNKEDSKATYKCEDCNSVQCSECEKYIHKTPRKEFHTRQILEAPKSELLCEIDRCSENNFADIRCKDCSKSYCYDCFEGTHKTPSKRKHQKLAFRDYLDVKNNPPPTTPESDQCAVSGFSDNSDSLNYESLNASLNHTEEPLDSGDFFSVQPQIAPGSAVECDMTKPANQIGSTPVSEPFCDDEDSLKFMVPQDHYFGEKLMDKNNFKLTDKNHEPPRLEKVRPDNNSLSDEISDALGSIPAMSDCQLDLQDGLQEVPLTGPASGQYAGYQGFKLVDEHEELLVHDVADFEKKLHDPTGPEEIGKVKVVSIFGNTGDGKSHTLNETFFGGAPVFKTSNDVESCTVGVWAAYDPGTEAIIVDTEGLLGVTSNQHQRTRLMLKILAVSDVVIYRTRAERLHSDMYGFIGDAFKAYWKHFLPELERCAQQNKTPVENMGPTMIIFHETQKTKTLDEVMSSSPEDLLQEKFTELGYKRKIPLKYVGTKTKQGQNTDFKPLFGVVKKCLEDITVRTPRLPGVILSSLKALNEKFSGDLDKVVPSTFPDQYFTCGVMCVSCNSRCELSMNHTNVAHCSKAHCIYQHQYENKVYLCKKCWREGKADCVVVPKMSEQNDSAWFSLAKYAWAGYVLECPRHGVIFRSRQHWYGNKDPEAEAVQTEVRHVWGDEGSTVLMGTHNAARRILEGVHYVTDTISTISAKPTKMMADWVNDKLAPAYWTPNAEIIDCHKCGKNLETEESKHHCRACGKGFCDECTSNKRPVPERGWGEVPVRVCKACLDKKPGKDDDSGSDTSDTQVTARKVMEGVTSTFGAVVNVMDYPIGVLKDSARPAYWLPDREIKNCIQCERAFSLKLKLHHCRCCGHGVCDDCSPNTKPVPSRGWDYPVRVCKKCEKKLKS
ncbi:zinc finger FYVE domain-containing protein 1 [Lingula anatina]|uniref:Zinc finger FYVE domain-containing protein 1 n=1 Tax=Lingula anatina TaxID=7574 RepID=A0A1S3I1K6_LINAN|nr:zinc finger FYVE domain-containing protein 1 [Lingula anatina]|eukprot:XP_013391711.1 zinc finger FYVE domain-containing protein 1 [Lingula anatina]